MVSREMERECVVVFDEAHNIDNVCIEALSGVCGCVWCPSVGVVVTGGAGRAGGEPCVVLGPKLCISPHITAASIPTQEALRAPRPSAVNLRQQTLDSAGRNIATLRREIERVKETDAGRLKAEYQRLLSGLQAQGALDEEDTQVGPGRRLGHGALCGPWCALPSLVRCAVPGVLPSAHAQLGRRRGCTGCSQLRHTRRPAGMRVGGTCGRHVWARCMQDRRPSCRAGQRLLHRCLAHYCMRHQALAKLLPARHPCTHAALVGQPCSPRGCAARGCARQHPPCRSGAGHSGRGLGGPTRGQQQCLPEWAKGHRQRERFPVQ